MALRQWDPDGAGRGILRGSWALEICTPPAKVSGWESWEHKCLNDLPPTDREQLMHDLGGEGSTDEAFKARQLSVMERKRLEETESAYIDAWRLRIQASDT